jgi:hypothetical protein
MSAADSKFNDESLKAAADKAREALDGAQAEASEPPNQDAPKQSGYEPNDLTRVPGAVGAFIDWVVRDAICPSRRLALGAALTTIGTLLGHCVRGPTGGGTHLYIVGLASTGDGKAAPMNAAIAALESIGAHDRVGPTDFRSSVGLINTLKKQPVFLAPIDEYGDYLQRLTHAKAGNYEIDTMNAMKKVFTLSFAPYYTPVSKTEKSVRIFAPAPSILGFSTAQAFYGAIQQKQTSGGLLNRHLILADEQTEFSPTYARAMEVPLELKQMLKALYKPRDVLKDILNMKSEEITTVVGTSFKPEIEMGWSAGAKSLFENLALEMRRESDSLRHDLFIRVAELAVRIATIAAGGCRRTTADEADMIWGRALALESAEMLYQGVLKYSIDPQDFPVQCRKVLQTIDASRDRSETGNPEMTVRDLRRVFRPFAKYGGDLEKVMKELVEAEQVRVYNRSTGGRPSPMVERLPD